jgi:riboflavin synthase
MFTGIIEEIGTVQDVIMLNGARRLRINAPKSAAEIKKGDSVAVDGVCLTATMRNGDLFHVEAVEETLKKTTIGVRRSGDRVNIELPLRMNERFGGHILLGHVDVVGTIVRVETRENSWMFYIKHPDEFSKYTIRVGSIAVNGVSLTVAERTKNIVGISIIPHTWENTTFQYLHERDTVNIEFDVIGKYILNLYEGIDEEQRILSEKHLRELGY